MSANHHIVDTAELRRLSGLKQSAAIKRWASAQGIKVRDGVDGPWTTLEALNASMGVGSAGNDDDYRPEDLL